MTCARAGDIAVVVAAAVALVVPAAAGALRFEGKTSKDVALELRVTPGGTPKRFEVGPTKIRCEDGTLSQARRRYGDFDRVRVGHFADRFKQRTRDAGIVLRERTKYVGDVRRDGSWRGTYEVNVRVYRKGERIDTCNLSTRWTAARKRVDGSPRAQP
jgi:hypothetical protein